MNLEVQYPELKEMKKDELFIEWAYIVKEFNYIKVYVRKIIPKKEKNIFVKALKQEYGVKDSQFYIDKEYPENNLFECINLVTIEK
jgi:hypothetical protein